SPTGDESDSLAPWKEAVEGACYRWQRRGGLPLLHAPFGRPAAILPSPVLPCGASAVRGEGREPVVDPNRRHQGWKGRAGWLAAQSRGAVDETPRGWQEEVGTAGEAGYALQPDPTAAFDGLQGRLQQERAELVRLCGGHEGRSQATYPRAQAARLRDQR